MFSLLRAALVIGAIFYFSPVRQEQEGGLSLDALVSAATHSSERLTGGSRNGSRPPGMPCRKARDRRCSTRSCASAPRPTRGEATAADRYAAAGGSSPGLDRRVEKARRLDLSIAKSRRTSYMKASHQHLDRHAAAD